MNKELLTNGIFIYKNIFENPDNLIKNIENAIKNKQIAWESATVKNNGEVKLNLDSRDTLIIGVPYDAKTNNEFINNTSKLFYNKFNIIEKDYMNMFNVNFKTHESWGILKYGEGQKFNNHIDDQEDFKRRISIVCYLNDNYDGGEINFPRFGITYKPKANEAICFPSSYVYNHSVSPVISGVRYAIVSWIW